MAEVTPPPAHAVADTAAKEPFPRTFYVANGVELFERLAFYGMYIGLSIYLTDVVKFGDVASSALLGNFRLVGSLAPIVCGAVADRISFRRSLVIAFVLLAIGYSMLFVAPSKPLAATALFVIAAGGGFMKPVITGTVARTAPVGREREGFATFYRMINAGSVIGKSAAYAVRALVSVRFVLVNSVIGSLAALGLTLAAYTEPERGRVKNPPSFAATLKGYGSALKNLRFAGFLICAAGFYFMAEQYYMTFPKYVTRHIDKKAPLEIITLINPAVIALFQGRVTSLFARVPPYVSMACGVFVAALSMFVMGIAPGLAGACFSGAIFACAEMMFSPPFYATMASFAPEGKAGMYMGMAFVPFAIGAWIGGMLSGPLIAKYLPEVGARAPLTVWATYAACGLACAFLMTGYAVFARTKPTSPARAT